MPSLNVTAITISPDPKIAIANASASWSVTAHGIASSAVIPDSRSLDGPERVCEQRFRRRRTAVSMELAVNFGASAPISSMRPLVRRLLLQVLSLSDSLLVAFRPLSK